MKAKKLTFHVLFLILAVFVSAAKLSAEEQAAAPVPPGVDPAKMEEIKRLSTPNENHKHLDIFVGNWEHTVRWKMKPEDEFTESKGTSKNEWIMDGRFLKQETKGEWMEQPFEGLGLTGYNNIKEEYETVWIDSMGTGMMKGTGKFDPATKTIMEEGTFSCPMTGEKDMDYRSEWKVIDADNYTYAMYGKADGKEFKTMEVIYKRA
jgi:hypothetical protein